MHGSVTQPTARSLTLREVPDDVLAAVKRGVLEHNIAHPAAQINQTDLICVAVREWLARGGHIPTRAKSVD